MKASSNIGLEEISGEGKSLYEKLENLPQLERLFHDWMADIGRLAGLNDSSLPLLDGRMGGGDGANAVKLCRRYPKLKVTVFDLPRVSGLTRANAEREGLSVATGHRGYHFQRQHRCPGTSQEGLGRRAWSALCSVPRGEQPRRRRRTCEGTCACEELR